MIALPRLQQRRGIYRWRIKLPGDLVQATGRREVSRSLRTDSYRLAKRRLVLAEADWARTTAAIRDGVQGGMTSEEIDALVRDFVRSELDERAALAKIAGTDEALAERLKENDAERERFRQIIVKEIANHGGPGPWRFTRGWVAPYLERRKVVAASGAHRPSRRRRWSCSRERY